MLKVHLEMDLNEHVTVVASHVLEMIKKSGGAMVYELLLRGFLKEHEYYTPDQLMDATTLLYALGYVNVDGYRISLNNV